MSIMIIVAIAINIIIIPEALPPGLVDSKISSNGDSILRAS